MAMNEFTFTRLAKAVAETKYSPEEVEKRALQELEGVEYTPTQIIENGYFMHCFSMTDSLEEIEFIILSHDGIAYIDTVSYREEVMDEGPFKGKTVHFPVPDTFSD
jgi:hypothetical protein